MRLPIALLALIPLPAAAQDFSCRNETAEIRCGDGACAIESASFTPMQLTRTGKTLQLCAYSGCWKGPILMRRTHGGVEMLHARLRGSGAIAVIHDRKARIAQMRWGGFANTMTCD